jgi:hypothetical protein
MEIAERWMIYLPGDRLVSLLDFVHVRACWNRLFH